ncbi:hypothetical protein KOEU_34990 [Komagataeibacter europaeus]|uniref:Uncharacterized protein n=1 Tax=Komagataeibacter europaeus TaxID=33995 RepID=A0A0M0ECM5_KOMEU|nr:hypothetical protein KOEU_34990 [Komagataeibacter europaeus]
MISILKIRLLLRRAFRSLKRRILISEFFTLDPYMFEILPFHYSDWFHFGLTEDVPPDNIMDARYCEINPYQKSIDY